MRDGTNPGEVIISWDAVPQATYYRIGSVTMVTDYPKAKSRPTGEWIEAFIYVDVNAINFPPVNGRVAYTIPGWRRARARLHRARQKQHRMPPTGRIAPPGTAERDATREGRNPAYS